MGADGSARTDGSTGRNGSAGKDGITFEEWREQFRADAQNCGRLHNADQLPDEVLRLFWNSGIAPTIRAMTEAGENTKAS